MDTFTQCLSKDKGHYGNSDLSTEIYQWGQTPWKPCISNMENLNAVMIEDGIPQPQRLKRLNEIAIHQMKILSAGTDGRNLLK